MGTKIAIIAIVSTMLGALYISKHNTTSRILVLHSYSTDYVWTNLIDGSLQRTFKKSAFNVKIRYFYMGTKASDYRENAMKVEQSFVETVNKFDPEVIIAVDDAAQNIISKHYLNHPDINVVFAGVNGSVEKYGYADANNITGIFEHKPVATIKKIIIELNQLQGIKDRSSVIFLADDSISSHNNADYIAALDWENINYHGTKHVTHYTQWQKFIIEESDKYDYILVSGYRNIVDEKNHNVDPTAIGRWTQINSHADVIGMNVFNSEDGILLSVGVSPHEQGSQALTMAIQITQGVSPRDIPYHYAKRYILAVSEDALYNPEVQQVYKKIFAQNKPSE